jgi:HEAT repeat protein
MALCMIARQALTGARTAKWLQKIGINREAVDTAVVIETLHSLSGHPCAETERVLLQFLQRSEPELRKAALQSLGWWEPIHRDEVLGAIRVARLDERSEIRKAALAAAARLGECAAIQTIRETLVRQHPVPVLDAIRVCGSEGLTWLWPDLDALTESDDPNIASEAWEIIEQLRERFMGIVS